MAGKWLYGWENGKVSKDIGETNNVTSQHPEIAAKIQQIILRERVMPTTKEFQFGTYADKS